MGIIAKLLSGRKALHPYHLEVLELTTRVLLSVAVITLINN